MLGMLGMLGMYVPVTSTHSSHLLTTYIYTMNADACVCEFLSGTHPDVVRYSSMLLLCVFMCFRVFLYIFVCLSCATKSVRT